MEKTLDFSYLKEIALGVGYDDVGYCQASIPQEDKDAFRKWLSKGMQGQMHYMENLDRLDPKAYFPEAKSVLMLLTYYKQAPLPFKKKEGLIASYARAKDYHNIHRSRSKQLLKILQQRYPSLLGKAFSDSYPLLERALAVQAGLGWIGKNTLLIHPRYGTFTLLAGLLLSEAISPPTPANKHWGTQLPRCGSCTRCQEACPVGALDNAYTLNSKKCLSYHLIEAKKAPSPSLNNPGYAFGCDLCQDNCPHNLKKPTATPPGFEFTHESIPYLSLEKLEKTQSPDLYGRPLKRKGVEGLKENLKQLLEKNKEA